MNREPRKPIRVCHISTVHRPNDVRIFVRECGSLAQAGYDVHLVIGADQEEIKAGIHIHPIRVPCHRLLRMLLGPWIALRVALKTKARLFHYHDPELIGLGFVLRWILGKKVVFDVHECVWLQLQTKHYLPTGAGWFLGGAYRLLERVLTVGQVKVVANAHSVRDYRDCTLVQNFPVLCGDILPAHRTFNPSQCPCLVYLGVVASIRGVYTYIELAHRLKLRGRVFRMVLIGEHPESLDYELREKLRTLDLEEEVEIHGRMDWYAAMRLVSEATIGLCLLQPVPNYTACLATKIIEYMMVGTPVLASNFDAWKPFVIGERVGVMADPTDIDDVLHAYERMIDDFEALEDMSQNGQKAVVDKYNWDVEFEKLRTAYEKTLGGKEVPRVPKVVEGTCSAAVFNKKVCRRQS